MKSLFRSYGPAGPPHRGRRNLLPLVLLLVGAALGIRLTGALLPQCLPDGDALGYLEAARHVARGEGLVTNWTRSLPRKDVSFPLPYRGYPALPLLAGGLGRLGLPLEGAGIGLVLALLALGLWAFWKAWELLWKEERGRPPSPWIALLAPALLGFHKHLTVATVEVLTDGPALAAGVLCLWLLLRAARTQKTKSFLLFSLLAGLSALAGGLFRFQDFFLLGLGPAWFLLGARGARKVTGPAAFLSPLLFLVPALPRGIARVESLLSSQAPPVPLQALAAAFAPGSPHSLFAGLGPLVWFSLAGILLLLVLRRPRPSSGWFLLLLYLAASLLPLLFIRPEKGWLHPWFFADRPALQLLPPLLLLALFPLAGIRKPLLPRLLALGLLVLLLLSARASWRYVWKRKRLTRPAEILEAARALSTRPGSPAVPLLSPETRFLAWEGDFRGFQARDPYSLGRVLESLRGRGAGWVFVSSRWDGGIPWARALLEIPESRVPPPLRLEGEFRSGGFKTRLFRVTGR